MNFILQDPSPSIFPSLFTQGMEPLVPGEQLGPCPHGQTRLHMQPCGSPLRIPTQPPKSKEGRAPITDLDLHTYRSQMILEGHGSVKSWT